MIGNASGARSVARSWMNGKVRLSSSEIVCMGTFGGDPADALHSAKIAAVHDELYIELYIDTTALERVAFVMKSGR